MTKESNINLFSDNGWVKIKNFSTKSEVSEIKKNIKSFLKKNYKNYS